jgi:hypothetical protein
MAEWNEAYDISKIAEYLMATEPEKARELWEFLLSDDVAWEVSMATADRLWNIFWRVIENEYIPGAELVEELIAETWSNYRAVVGIEQVDGSVLAPIMEVLRPKSMYDVVGSPDRPEGR